jgi:pimeloyl-ACP methyl ester carboxylesterase
MDAVFRLPDGRQLGYADYGRPDGIPVFYFHGFPGSRLEARLLHASGVTAGVHIIAPDRPGCGLSTYQPRRTLLDWPADVAALAGALELSSFGVVGISGGGPYALACARQLPEHVTSVSLISSLGPLDETGAMQGMGLSDRVFLSLADRLPWLAQGILGLLSWVDLKGLVRQTVADLCQRDQAALADPQVWQMLLDETREAFRQGPRGVVHEAAIYKRPWGFYPGEIQTPVLLWQGEDDHEVPPRVGHALAQALPNCQAHFIEGEGHISLAYNHMDEVMGSFSLSLGRG